MDFFNLKRNTSCRTGSEGNYLYVYFLTDSQKLVSVYKGSIRLVPQIIDDKDIDLRTESSEQLSTLFPSCPTLHSDRRGCE